MGRNTRGKSTSEDGDGLKNTPGARRKTQQDGRPLLLDLNHDDVNIDECRAQKGDRIVVDCNLCAEEIDDQTQKAVMCQKCCSWSHQGCANLNNQEMKALDKGRLNLMWFCNNCTADVMKILKGLPTQTQIRNPDNVNLTEVVHKLDQVADTMHKMVD